MALVKPEFGSIFRSSNCSLDQACSFPSAEGAVHLVQAQPLLGAHLLPACQIVLMKRPLPVSRAHSGTRPGSY